MKRKISFLTVLLLSLSLLLSGCIQFVVEFKVNSDKSGDFSLTVGMSSEVLKQMEDTLDPSSAFSEIIESAEDNGWKTEDYQNEKFTGITVKGTVSDCTSEEAMKDSLGALMKFQEVTVDGKKGMNVSINASDFISMLTEQAGTADLTELKQLGDMDVSIKITMPYTITEHNGTAISSDKKTVTWDLTATKETELKASSIEGSSKGGIPILYILIGAVVIIVIGSILKKKK